MDASLEDHRRRVADAIAAEAVHGDRAALAHQIWACVHGYVMLDIFLGRAADDEAVRSAFTVAFGRVLDGLAIRAEG